MMIAQPATLLFAMLLYLAICLPEAAAVEPGVRSLDLRGLQIGATTTLTIEGTDLAPDSRLVLPFAASQKLHEGATATKAVWDVTLDEQPIPGVYNLRVATDSGTTAPIIIGVDRRPQLPLTREIAALPVALHGTLSGSSVAETRFRGTGGQEVTLEVESQRLGGKLRPVIHLYDSQHVQLAWAWPTNTLHGDTRLTAKLPAEGQYIVQLHDAEYAAPAPGHYRLKIGTWQSVDLAFPPAVPRGATTAVELLTAASAKRIDATPANDASWLALPWPDGALASGLRPRVLVSDTPELLETPGAVTELTSYPLGVSGRLSAVGEEDRFRVPVTPGDKLRLEVFAERCGSPLDAVLLVRNEQGQTLARGEDGPGTVDPLLEYTVPDRIDSLHLAVRDLHGRGGPNCVYRLAIEATSPPRRATGFDLKLATDRIRVARDGRSVVPVYVTRRDYAGPIRLTLDGLPSGLSLHNEEIPEQSEGTLLAIEGAAGPAEQMLTLLRGTSADGGVTRLARDPDHPLAVLQPWLAQELSIAATAAAGFTADWGELSSDATLPLGGRLTLPIQVTRPEEQKGPVRFTLLSSQEPLKVNGRPDPNRSLRAEAAVELAADKTAGELKLVIPVDLSSPTYDLALQAELLSADKKIVLHTACTPVRRLGTLHPLALELASTRLEGTLDPKTGATVKLTGKVERKADLKGDVTITASGLPAGLRAGPLVIKADATEFELPLMFPANFKPGDVTGIKLVASAVPDPKLPQAVLRTAEVDVVVALLAAESK